MSQRRTDLQAQFADRADAYRHSDWHAEYAAGLVRQVPFEGTETVVDAGAGTGMAADAVARRLGAGGRVLAVDISAAMLRQHRPSGTVDHVLADAARLPLPAASVDVVICSAALLYLPVERALAEWHRVLRPGGLVAFSAMGADQPPAAALFRELAVARGLPLPDPSARLGTAQACRAALTTAGFTDVRVTDSTVHFSPADLAAAWPVHERVHRDRLRATFDEAGLIEFERHYRQAAEAQRDQLTTAQVHYAIGRKP